MTGIYTRTLWKLPCLLLYSLDVKQHGEETQNEVEVDVRCSSHSIFRLM